jgi:hypothetical protein
MATGLRPLLPVITMLTAMYAKPPARRKVAERRLTVLLLTIPWQRNESVRQIASDT